MGNLLLERVLKLDIVVYTLPIEECVNCRAVDLFLRKRGIEVTKVRLDEVPDAADYVRSLGYSQAPVIVLSDAGEVVDHWSGFRYDRMNELTNLAVA